MIEERRDPTPEEIKAACEEILKNETPAQLRARRKRSKLPLYEGWTPPVVRVNSLNPYDYTNISSS